MNVEYIRAAEIARDLKELFSSDYTVSSSYWGLRMVIFHQFNKSIEIGMLVSKYRDMLKLYYLATQLKEPLFNNDRLEKENLLLAIERPVLLGT